MMQAYKLYIVRVNMDKIDEIWLDQGLGALYFKYINTMSEKAERIEVKQFLGVKNACKAHLKSPAFFTPVFYPVIFKNDFKWNER